MGEQLTQRKSEYAIASGGRLRWVDCLRGIAMLLVIFGHLLPKEVSSRWIYFVFTSPIKLPLFFMITGYVFRDREGKQGVFFKNLLLKLIVPWLSLTAIPVFAISLFKGVQYLKNGLLEIVTGETAWYLPCCIMAEIIWFYTHKLLKAPKARICMSLALSAVGFALSLTVLSGKFLPLTALIAQGFLAMGYLFRLYEDRFRSIKWRQLACCALAYIGLGLASCYWLPGQSLDVHLNEYYALYVSLPMILIGCYTLFTAASKAKVHFAPLEYVGKNTLVYYMLATYPVMAFAAVVHRLHYVLLNTVPTAILNTAVVCIGCAVIAAVLNLLLPWLVGKKWKKRSFLKSTESATSTKKVVGNAIIYSAGGILLKCFSFFLLPLYTAYLTKEEYGTFSLANSFIHTMMYIVGLSLYSAVMRFYVDLKNDREKLKRFYGTVSLFTMLSGIFWLAAFSVFKGLTSRFLFSGASYFPIILLTLVALVFTCQATIYDDILKSQQKAIKSSIISIVIFFVTLGLNITFVVALKWGAAGSLLALAISQILYTAIFLIDMLPRRQIKFCLDFKLLKDALRYSVPIIPHNLATKIAVLISKLLIGGTDSMGSLGVYSVAAQLGEIPDTLQTYVDKAYQPWLFEKLNAQEQDYKKSIRSTARMLIAVLGVLFVCIALFSQDYILLLVERSYVEAWKLVPLIVLVYAIKTIYYFYVEVLFFHKQAVKKLFLAALIGSILNVLLSFFLIPAYGAIGSITADAIAMVVRVAIVVWMSKSYENIGLFIVDFLVNFLMVAGFIALGLLPSLLYFGNHFSIVNLGYKCAVILAYVAFVLFTYRKQLRPLFKALKAKLHHGNN